MAATLSERCADPECGVILVSRRQGLKAAELPPGHGIHYGRNLCKVSHRRARLRGELHKYPSERERASEILDLWQSLRRPQFDYSIAQVADLVGITSNALAHVLDRARKASDPRAVPARDTRFKPAPRRRSPQPDVGPGFDPDTRDEGEETA